MEKILPFLAKPDTKKFIKEICDEKGIDYDTFEELIGEEFKQQGKGRKHGITDAFDDVLSRIYHEDQE